MTYVRTCLECGHRQKAKPPNGYDEMKCKRCGSESLDYGSEEGGDDSASLVETVLARLLVRDDSLRRHVEVLLFEYDFTVDDAVRYGRCWEEVSPNLEEETALRRMREIGSRYPKYLRRTKP